MVNRSARVGASNPTQAVRRNTKTALKKRNSRINTETAHFSAQKRHFLFTKIARNSFSMLVATPGDPVYTLEKWENQ